MPSLPFALAGMEGVTGARTPVTVQIPAEAARTASRHLMTLAMVMALLTGLVVSQLFGVVGRPMDVAPSQHTERTARFALAYYDALNHALSSKDAGPLEALLGHDYIGHVPASGTLERRDALLDQIEDLRSTFPGTRLEAEVLSSSAHLVVVRVVLEASVRGKVLEIPLEQSAPQSSIEILRFEGSELVERWGAAWWPVVLEPLASIDYMPVAATVLQPRLERVTLHIDGRMSLMPNASHLVLVETGTLTVDGTHTQRASGIPPFQIIPGSPTALSAHGSYSISNSGNAETTFLLLRMQLARAKSEQFEAFWESGGFGEGIASRSVLIAGNETPSVKGVWTVSIVRLSLAPGIALAEHRIDGAELLVVEQGTIVVDGRSCTSRCAHTTDGAARVVSGDVVVDAQKGFAVQDASVAYRTLGESPATVLLIQIAHR
jgi:predicted ester cyclase